MQKLSTWYRKVGFFGLDGSNCIDDRLVDYPALSAFCHTSVQRQNLHSYNSLVGGNRKSYKLARRLTVAFQKFDNLEEALVEGSLISLAAGRSDKILAEIQR